MERVIEHNLDIICYICFSYQDGRVYAERLIQELLKYSVQVLTPKVEISPGSRWVDALQDILNRADVMIFVVTPDALNSKWVSDEVQYFEKRKGRIIPIVFGDTISLISVPIFLNDIQWLREDLSALSKGPSHSALAWLARVFEQMRSEDRQLTSPSRHVQSRPKSARLMRESSFSSDEEKLEKHRLSNVSLKMNSTMPSRKPRVLELRIGSFLMAPTLFV